MVVRATEKLDVRRSAEIITERRLIKTVITRHRRVTARQVIPTNVRVFIVVIAM